jgi:hypothetical protein
MARSKEQRDRLVLFRRHGQGLDHAIGVFDQSIGLVRQRQILLDTPEPLQRLQIDVGVFIRPDHTQQWGACVDCHRRASARVNHRAA